MNPRINIDIKDYSPYKDKNNTNNNFSFNSINKNSTFDHDSFNKNNNLLNNIKPNVESYDVTPIRKDLIKEENGFKNYYNANGHLYKTMINNNIIYEEYSSGKVKINVISGWKLEFNENGTIKKIANSNSYLWSDKSLYKIDNNGDIVIYDKDDENKIYMKLTKDGNKQELYSTDDYYKEIVDYTRYLFNLLKDTYGEEYYSTFHDKSNSLYKKFLHNNIYIAARYNYSSGSLEWVKFPDGREINFDLNGILKSEKLQDNTKKEYYSNQKLKSVRNTDDTFIEYDDKSNVTYDKKSDGICRQYYKNGNVMSEQMPNSTIIYYSKNNDFLYKKLKDGTIEYNNPDILKKSYYNDCITEEYKDGTKKYYNSESQLYKIEKGDNEIEFLAGRSKADLDYNRSYNNYELYDDNGKLLKKCENGVCIYDEYPSGQVRLKKLENGGEVQYNEDGSLQIYSYNNSIFGPPYKIKSDIRLGENGYVYIVDLNDENKIYEKIYNNELIEVNNYLDLDKVISESNHYSSDDITKTYINNRLIKSSSSNYYSDTKNQITFIKYMDGNAERYINGNIKEKYDINTKTLTIYDELGNIEKIEQNVSCN